MRAMERFVGRIGLIHYRKTRTLNAANDRRFGSSSSSPKNSHRGDLRLHPNDQFVGYFEDFRRQLADVIPPNEFLHEVSRVLKCLRVFAAYRPKFNGACWVEGDMNTKALMLA